MSWCAVTEQGQLRQGTVLGIFEQPWEAGQPVRHLPSGANLALRFPNGASADLDVVAVTAAEAVIQLSNQSRWRMIQVSPKQLNSWPDTGGAPPTYWIIKEQIVDTDVR